MTFFIDPFFSVTGLFLLQLLLIYLIPRILHQGLKNIGQPLVLSEIISGIILGPTLLGRIPNFSDWIFPASSQALLNIIAQWALVLFLFIVGMSLPLGKIKKHWLKVLVASVLGNITPWIAAVPLAFFFQSDTYVTTSLGITMLILAVGLGVSALSFLARVLGEMGLLGTDLSVMTLCTTAVDTGVAWIEFAVALSIADGGGTVKDYLIPLWVILLSAAQLVVVFVPCRFVMRWIAKHVEKKGQLEVLYFIATMWIVFGVSWLSEQIGISALLGAFEFGLVVPKRGPLIKELKSRLEDFVVVLMLPIFFVLIGLKTNFGLLNTWDLWLYIPMLAAAATAVKAPGVMIPGKLFGLDWFDTTTFGVLMSCKGLVALTIYNLALGSGLITPLFFTILVGYVIVTTFLVTPLVRMIDFCKKCWVGKVKRRKTNTYGVFMLPRTPNLAAPIATIANALLALPRFNAAGKQMNTKMVIARVVDPNDKVVGIPTRRQLKQDTIFSAATQRSRFFRRKMDYEYIVTTDPQEDVLKRINLGPSHGKFEREKILLVGNDETDKTRSILVHLLAFARPTIAIYTGPDIGNKVGRMMLPYRDTQHDRLALEMVRAVAHATSHPDIVVLLLPGSPDPAELDFLQEGESETASEETDVEGEGEKPKKEKEPTSGKDYWFGKKARVTITDRRDEEEEVITTIVRDVEEYGDVELLIMGRIDNTGSEDESKDILNQFVEKMYACIYVSAGNHNTGDSTTEMTMTDTMTDTITTTTTTDAEKTSETDDIELAKVVKPGKKQKKQKKQKAKKEKKQKNKKHLKDNVDSDMERGQAPGYDNDSAGDDGEEIRIHESTERPVRRNSALPRSRTNSVSRSNKPARKASQSTPSSPVTDSASPSPQLEDIPL